MGLSMMLDPRKSLKSFHSTNWFSIQEKPTCKCLQGENSRELMPGPGRDGGFRIPVPFQLLFWCTPPCSTCATLFCSLLQHPLHARFKLLGHIYWTGLESSKGLEESVAVSKHREHHSDTGQCSQEAGWGSENSCACVLLPHRAVHSHLCFPWTMTVMSKSPAFLAVSCGWFRGNVIKSLSN